MSLWSKWSAQPPVWPCSRHPSRRGSGASRAIAARRHGAVLQGRRAMQRGRALRAAIAAPLVDGGAVFEQPGDGPQPAVERGVG